MPPTKPGWYWFQSCTSCTPHFVFVRANGEYGIPPNIRRPEEGAMFDFEVCTVGGPGPFDVFTGPIPSPACPWKLSQETDRCR